MVRRRDVEEYLQRDWARVARLKDEHWRRRTARLGLAEVLRVTGELRRQALAARGGWPAPEDREEDLENHRRLAQKLARVPRLRRH